MAFIKVKPIRVTVFKSLRYAANKEKTTAKIAKDKDIENELKYITDKEKTTYLDELHKDISSTLKEEVKEEKEQEEIVLSSGINCVSEPQLAYYQFETIYKKYPEKLTWGTKEGKKSAIKAHHFMQSFKPGEIDPLKAHELGKELCERAFEGKYQILISTHVNKEHIHNHIILNAIGLDGQKYASNTKSLRNVRAIGDDLCREYGLSIIVPKPKGTNRYNTSYKEWSEKKQGTSWKEKIRLDIDKLVIKVDSLEQLLEELKKDGYEIKKGKYISIRPEGKERFVRTKTLGEEYTEEALEERIKNKELNQDNRVTYTGIQVPYIKTIQVLGNEIQKDSFRVYRKANIKKPYSINNDYYIDQLASQLMYLTKNKIESEKQLSSKMDEVKTLNSHVKEEINKVNKIGNTLREVCEQIKIYNQLCEKNELTTEEAVKLENSIQTLKRYKIEDSSDMKKIMESYKANNQRIKELNKEYELTQNHLHQVEDIYKTYEQVKNNEYINKVKNTERDINKNK